MPAVSMTRLRHILLLLLILGPHLALSEEEEEDAYDDSEEDSSREADFSEAEVTLSRSICLEAKFHEPESPLVQRCCSHHVTLDDDTVKCEIAFNSSGKNDTMRLANLADCYFTTKQYGKGEKRLDFQRIKADLDRGGDPRETEFMMKLYKMCSEEAKRQMKLMKGRTDTIKTQLGRRPFYTIVLTCITMHSEKISCPYFLWSPEKCQTYADACKVILDGK